MDFDDSLDPEERTRIQTQLRALHGIKAHDVVLLAAARIVPNKQTEIAGRLTAALGGLRGEMVGKRLYNGQVLDEASRVVLVIAGRPERGFIEYQRTLFEYLDSLEVDWLYAGDRVRTYCDDSEGLYALYPDVYAMADFVLYPTGWEGFGNQLLEAFAAELPVAVFEYPVFKEDIAPKGVRVVSLGDRTCPARGGGDLVDIPDDVLARAAREMLRIITDAGEFRDIVDRNTSVGREHFSFDVLRSHLYEGIAWATTHRS
jgi:glycosyltransferase involved in cell wall biosynthesis